MQHDGWRHTLVWREALLNVFSFGGRLFPLLCFAVLLGAGQVMFMASESNTLKHELNSLYLSGRNIIVFTPAVQGTRTTISRRSCESLSSADGVQRAGLFVIEGTQDFAQLGRNIPVVAASVSLFPSLARSDAVVGSLLGSHSGPYDLGLPGGVDVRAVSGQKQPTGVDTNSAVVVPLAANVTKGNECIVVLDRFSRLAEATPRLAASLAVTGGPIVGESQLNESVNVIQQYIGRPGRLFALALGLLAGLAAALLNRFRSSEFAAYRMSGTSPRTLALLIAEEQWLLAGTATASSILAVIVLQTYFFAAVPPVLWSVAAGLLWVVVACLGSIGPVIGSPMKLAKDR
jgi:hypothetical protein